MQSFTPKRVFAVVLLMLTALLATIAVMYFYPLLKNAFFANEKPDFSSALTESNSGNAEQLQEFLVRDIQAGNKNNETVSAVHWILHRYFDNGGDIYEIYDFVNKHPELGFVRQAEQFDPVLFERIRTNRVPNYGIDSIMALLYYYEAIDQAGYGGIALWGTAANKYSELALSLLKLNGSYDALSEDEKTFLAFALSKARKFAGKANVYIIQNTQETNTLDDLLHVDIVQEDLLVGLNQFASAVLNLQGAGDDFISDYHPAQIFEFNSAYALDYVPRLYFFTNYLYATALLAGGIASPESVAAPLTRCIEYARANAEWRPAGSVNRVINSKSSNENSVFAYTNTKALAALSPEFKAWLAENGWTETDF